MYDLSFSDLILVKGGLQQDDKWKELEKTVLLSHSTAKFAKIPNQFASVLTISFVLS